MSWAQAATSATQPSLLWMKVNSRQESVAVTDGSDEMPSTTSRHVEMAPVWPRGMRGNDLHFTNDYDNCDDDGKEYNSDDNTDKENTNINNNYDNIGGEAR